MAEAGKNKKQQRSAKPSARKRARQNLKRRAQNRSLVSKMRNEVKELKASLTAKNKSEAAKLIKTALPTIASMVNKGILHANTAARYTSKLMKEFNSL